MPERRPSQFSILAVLKLLTVLALILSIVPISPGYYWIVVLAAAAIGIFLAEHFPQPKSWQIFFLLIFPSLFAGITTIWPQLTASEPAALDEVALLFLLGFLIGVVPVALSVVALGVFSSIVHRFTGIRLLKFEWGLAAETHSAGEQAAEREPE
ncbi:hypothetical protein M4951_16975 [Blastopirellula sp. J2-11]|uniref:hypothetical protein n=1 Tax=Blastopirellula sp. J2-11 TaxID=2943192 RepID=UPI0021C65F40|nr:hypothetical protein [Blastopirellula sp. J2-11]UUO05071.1 hypothetical protein M4951_16975 [Blastopirellula sp. J2-11]